MRHYHALSEEIYFILEGIGELEIDRETRTVGPGDAALIPPGSWHTLAATTPLRLLCSLRARRIRTPNVLRLDEWRLD